MGLDINGTKFLLYAGKHGVSFEDTAMIGRQSMLIEADRLGRNLALFGYEASSEESGRLLNSGFAEEFLGLLGAGSITSFDASDYEGASIVHDMNTPIADEYKGRFSAVLDGGTLEHVFNLPMALQNCMEMVRVGGHFLTIAPANNYFGHGFYQFSPELFYRVLSEANGFAVEKMMVYEETFENDWFEVADPAVIGERVVLMNREPTLLLVIARRVAEVAVSMTSIQQSDYKAAWQEEGAAAAINETPGVLAKVWRRLEHWVDRSNGMLAKNGRHFKRVKLP